MADPLQVPGEGRRPQLSQVRALRDLGLNQAQRSAFFRAESVVFHFPTREEPAIAVAHLAGSRLRCGIISIRDVGGGVRDLGQFRDRCQAVARSFGASELELFGAAVINQRLQALLVRQGFARLTELVPEELGGGTMEVLSRVFPVR